MTANVRGRFDATAVRRMAFVLVALSLLAAVHAQSSCTITIGGVFATSGSAGEIGVPVGNGAQLAVDDFNAAGGVNGCQLALKVMDDQSQASVGVDAAKKLVDIDQVPAIVGAISSGITVPIVTTVTAPAKVVQISPASSTPLLTQLAQQGKTGGYFFRTVISDAELSIGMAQAAKEAGFTRVAVLYLNNPYGSGVKNTFDAAFKQAGGTVTSQVVFNPGQPSYRAEVKKALANDPQALFMVGYPADSETILREWVSAGGPQKFLLPEGLNTQKFLDAVGVQYMGDTWGVTAGSTKTPAVKVFDQEYTQKYGSAPSAFVADSSYDAVAVIGLAMEAAKAHTGTAIRDHIRAITATGGTEVYAGVAGFKKAKQLLAEGKTIRYVGATGPIQFDANGNVGGPQIVWRVENGKIANVKTLTVDQIKALKAKIAQ